MAVKRVDPLLVSPRRSCGVYNTKDGLAQNILMDPQRDLFFLNIFSPTEVDWRQVVREVPLLRQGVKHVAFHRRSAMVPFCLRTLASDLGRYGHQFEPTTPLERALTGFQACSRRFPRMFILDLQLDLAHGCLQHPPWTIWLPRSLPRPRPAFRSLALPSTTSCRHDRPLPRGGTSRGSSSLTSERTSATTTCTVSSAVGSWNTRSGSPGSCTRFSITYRRYSV
jgi:hypothetical protein